MSEAKAVVEIENICGWPMATGNFDQGRGSLPLPFLDVADSKQLKKKPDDWLRLMPRFRSGHLRKTNTPWVAICAGKILSARVSTHTETGAVT
jgi:hypothetical protein